MGLLEHVGRLSYLSYDWSWFLSKRNIISNTCIHSYFHLQIDLFNYNNNNEPSEQIQIVYNMSQWKSLGTIHKPRNAVNLTLSDWWLYSLMSHTSENRTFSEQQLLTRTHASSTDPCRWRETSMSHWHTDSVRCSSWQGCGTWLPGPTGCH